MTSTSILQFSRPADRRRQERVRAPGDAFPLGRAYILARDELDLAARDLHEINHRVRRLMRHLAGYAA